MSEQYIRTQMLLGDLAMQKLSQAKVAVFGIGGVGGYCVEALARSGINNLDIIDNDTICLSNLNRQIIALHSTIGQYKVDVAKKRILDINPSASVNAHKEFFSPDNSYKFDFSAYDYVIDAVDTVSAKLEIIVKSKAVGTPVISSMGAGNKLNPTLFEVDNISRTSVCPLAKVMRRELKQRGISNVKVVYSKEIPIKPAYNNVNTEVNTTDIIKRSPPGSTAFVPSVVGLIIAGEVIKDISGI